jgi:hypothetical protein
LIDRLGTFADRLPAGEWAELVLRHHERVQREKPPRGKAPWYEHFDDGTCVIRPGYRRDTGGTHDGSYVHAYRTQPLWSFALDLGLVT